MKSSTSVLAFLLLTLGLTAITASQAYTAVPLLGYQQGVMLQIAPPAVLGGQCLISGVPSPTGYADQSASPLFLYTPQNTGTHNLQFDYNTTLYTLSPFLAPGQTKLQIDDSNAVNPIISFNSLASPVGQSGAVTVFLSDKVTGAVFCSSQIQLVVDQPLACLPTSVSSNGQFVYPAGSIYAPTYVQNVVIQEFVTINNININTVVINVNNISNNTIIPTPPPPTPPPVNCTATPANPICSRTPTPTPAPTNAGPAPGPAMPPAKPPATPHAAPPAKPPATPPATPPAMPPATPSIAPTITPVATPPTAPAPTIATPTITPITTPTIATPTITPVTTATSTPVVTAQGPTQMGSQLPAASELAPVVGRRLRL